MKKIGLFFLLLITTIANASAQNDDSHLMFKGIPIKGKAADMSQKLQAIGYTKNSDCILRGEFIGKDCLIQLSETPITKEIYMVAVCFKVEDSWHSLKSDYKEIKEMLVKKYNVEPQIYEAFLYPYQEGDGYELQALRKERCVYASNFEVENGAISVSITKNQNIVIYYWDEIGNEICGKESEKEILNDL